MASTQRSRARRRVSPIPVGGAVVQKKGYVIFVSTEAAIRKRDKNCVYCGIAIRRFRLKQPREANVEHIDNENICPLCVTNLAMCCRSCNSSKSTRPLSTWLDSRYRLDNEITRHSVSQVVKKWLWNYAGCRHKAINGSRFARDY